MKHEGMKSRIRKMLMKPFALSDTKKTRLEGLSRLAQAIVVEISMAKENIQNEYHVHRSWWDKKLATYIILRVESALEKDPTRLHEVLSISLPQGLKVTNRSSASDLARYQQLSVEHILPLRT